MKLLGSLLLLISFSGFAQSSDFLILKKRNKPVKYIYAGTQIEFVTTNGAYRDAFITAIKSDSLYLQEFYVIKVPMSYGSYKLDTAGSFRYTYHYNQIKSFGKQQKGFDVKSSGAALLGGGILLTVASIVSYIVNPDKFSPELMGAAIVLGTAGYFMAKSGNKGMPIGKKYELEYMNMTAK